ncbi:hypothetical protein C3L33_17763, partial [Rhododendron williamsianum]
MLKLLEFHFHIKEDFKKDVIQGIIVDTVLSQAEVGGNNENLLMTGKDKKRKTRMKIEERGPQVNLDEYAAIDVHNINLIYLRRNLMESLVVDSGKFHEKVVGSIVRIRISNNDQKQDMYRLVQVVGTSKAALPYKIGEKTADFVLEILNLDKKETISIDVISNQAFSEGQVHEKAVALQEVRLNDFTLRECIEKLVLLKTPEERQRRLHEIPEVHADPKMDPNCDSDQDVGEVDNKKQGDNVKPRYSGFGRKRRESITAQNGDSQKSSGTRPWKKLNTCGQNRSLPTKFYLENGAPSRVVQRAYDSCYEGKDSCATNSSAKPGNRVDSCGSVGGGRNNQAVLRSESFRVRDQKLPFHLSLLGLRKWSTTGYFPPEMRIWCINNEEVDSVLLTDVLNGKFCKVFPLQSNISLPSQGVIAPGNRLNYLDDRSSGIVNTTSMDGNKVNCPLGQQDGTSLHQGKRQEEKICSSASNDGNLTSHESTTFQTSGEESHVNQSQGSPGQSSGGNSKNGDSNSGFESVARSSDSSDPKLETNIPNLPSPMPITSNGDLEASYSDEKADSNMQNLPSPPLMLGDGNKKTETAENKQPASSKCPVQDSGSSGSSASSLVVGGERQCRETADEWSGCSPARAKPSVEEGDSGLGSVTSLKPPELASDHAATPTSKCDQLTPPSPPQPVFNESTWRPEPIEFSTLDEESVSDLLAEVDAMESQCGLASPTSMMYSDDELFQDPNNDCFTNIGVLSHPLNLGRSDALSSMRDITLPRQSMMTDEPLGAAQLMLLIMQPNTSQRAEQKPMNASWGTMQGNMNLGLGGINNVGWGSGLSDWESSWRRQSIHGNGGVVQKVTLGLLPKGREFVNFTRMEIARRERFVTTSTHDEEVPVYLVAWLFCRTIVGRYRPGIAWQDRVTLMPKRECR